MPTQPTRLHRFAPGVRTPRRRKRSSLYPTRRDYDEGAETGHRENAHNTDQHGTNGTTPHRASKRWLARIRYVSSRNADADADEENYLPLRRIVLFIEESLDGALRWADFEPNDVPRRRPTVSAQALARRDANERDAGLWRR